MDRNDKQPRRKRHWWRWTAAGVVLLAVVVVGGMRSFAGAPGPIPLALPAAGANLDEAPLDGTWDVTSGSIGGFRVEQSSFGASSDIVGRTDAVTGSLVVAGDDVTAATFQIDLTTIEVGDKPAPQFATVMDTGADPVATFTSTAPIALSAELTSGSTVTGSVAGELTLRGTSQPVTFAVSERRDGATLLVAGSTPIAFADWDIAGPANYGVLGSLADHGVAEVLLVLARQR